MPRSVNAVASRARRKKILKAAKGYWGARSKVYTVAKNAVEKGLTYAYRDRKNKKRAFRRLVDCSYQCSRSYGGYNLLQINESPFKKWDWFKSQSVG